MTMNIDIKALLKGRAVDTVIIHCTATKPNQDIGATEVDRMHRKRGFIGCGYHYIIRRDGTIESADQGHKCRDISIAGAHVGDCGAGWNKRTIGISLVGGVSATLTDGKQPKPENNFTDAQWESLRFLVRTIDTSLGTVKWMGHRDLIKLCHAPPKACPCFEVAEFMTSVYPSSHTDVAVTVPFKNRYTDSRLPLQVNTHIVAKGDTLWKLSHLYGVPIETLMSLNGLSDSTLTVGHELKLHSNPKQKGTK